MLKEKILLLNPPGNHLYLRDYYCSKVSQANYINHPIDLLIQSGYLAGKFDVLLIDAIVSQLNKEACLDKIKQSGASIILLLCGAASFEEDIAFVEELRQMGDYRIIASGDIMRENPEEKLRAYPSLEAILLDFSTPDLLNYLSYPEGRARNMVYRKKGVIETGECLPSSGQYEIPIPCHELFIDLGYRYPFVRHKRFATVLTDFGCPFHCNFCIMSTLGFKYRWVENVLEELRYIKSLGIRELFFLDQSFGAVKTRSIELCQKMIEAELNLGWTCFSRSDILDEKGLRLMKQAGCHTIILGVESGSAEILEKYRKEYTKEQVKEAFSMCKRLGIETVGTFILGLPDETMTTASETMKFIKELNCDFASFNVAVPRRGTQLRAQALTEGLIDSSFDVMDQSGTSIAMNTKYLSKEQVLALRRQAVQSFYLRPKYLLKRLVSVNSYSQLLNFISQGLSLLRRTWGKD